MPNHRRCGWAPGGWQNPYRLNALWILRPTWLRNRLHLIWHGFFG